MGVTDWSVAFNLTSKVYTDDPEPGTEAPDPLPLNQVWSLRGGEQVIYRLRPDACSLTNSVRETKDFIPQSDGAILHRRFAGGMEMQLTIQMWLQGDIIACDFELQQMIDTLNGYLYGLMNAGDNEGRVSWTPSGMSARMLDDIRLLSYPVESQSPGAPYETVVTVDCALPYAENLTQLTTALPGTLANLGNRPTFPVYQIYGPYDGFVLTNTTTGDVLEYDGTQPGASTVAALHYIEIDTFRNTMFLDGSGANRDAGLVMVDSDFSPLVPGNNVMTLTFTAGGAGNASSQALVNAAWA